MITDAMVEAAAKAALHEWDSLPEDMRQYWRSRFRAALAAAQVGAASFAEGVEAAAKEIEALLPSLLSSICLPLVTQLLKRIRALRSPAAPVESEVMQHSGAPTTKAPDFSGNKTGPLSASEPAGALADTELRNLPGTASAGDTGLAQGKQGTGADDRTLPLGVGPTLSASEPAGVWHPYQEEQVARAISSTRGNAPWQTWLPAARAVLALFPISEPAPSEKKLRAEVSKFLDRRMSGFCDSREVDDDLVELASALSG